MKEFSKKNLSTAIYVRVSTDEQAQEGFSIRAQIEKLKSYALLKDWDIYDIYNDEGISGKNIIDRPDINRLIEDIENGKVNNVLVFKVDRLTRSTKNLLELVELFEEYNCAFNSLTESIDTDTPSGRMFLKIIAIFAEFERENLISRVKMGLERKVKEGYTLANYLTSYGYTKDRGQKVQEINPFEATILKEIASMFLDKDMSFNGIAKNLVERKIPTKSGSGSWSATIIKQILTNPTYIGKVRYSTDDEDKYFEADGQHERILSDEVFYTIQEKIKNMPNLTRTKKPSDKSYFCGVLTCGMCGGKYTTHNYSCKAEDDSEEKQYKTSYRCSRQSRLSEDMKCKNPAIAHVKMEHAFIEYIQKINDLTDTKNVNIEDATQKSEQELLGYIIDIEKKLTDLQNRKRQVMERYVNGEMEFEEYKSILKITNDKYDGLDSELQRKKAELPNITATSKILPKDIILNIQKNWDKLDNSERKMFLQRFIKRITITVEKESKTSSMVKINTVEFNTCKPNIKEKDKNAVRTRLKNAMCR